MIKVSVMYPNRPGVRFDHRYYRDKHLPLIQRRMGAGLKYYAIDRGVSGGTADSPALYVGMCHLMCESVESYHAAFDPYATELSRDVLNFTDAVPVVEISDMVVEHSSAV